MALISDEKGFLVADPKDISELSTGIDGVRSDTHAILALLKSGSKAGILRKQKVSNPNSGSAGPARSGSTSAPAARPRDGATGRFTKSPELSHMARAVTSLTRQQAEQISAQKREAVEADKQATKDQSRDARGRFGKGSGGGKHSGTSEGILGGFKSFASKFTGGGHGHGGDIGDFEKVDPAIAASKEISSLVGGPLGALGGLGKSIIGRGFGGKDKAIPWYQKIFGELRLSRTKASGFSIAQERTLQDIDRKLNGHGGPGVTKKGLLPTLASAASGGVGGILKSLGGGAMSLLGGGKGLLKVLGKGALGLGKRLPLLGALFAGGSALASIFGKDDPTKSKEENRTDRFTGGGSGIGALIGGGIGLLGGPVGAMIGGVIGDKVGELVGAWLATVDWSAVGKDITDAWDTTTKFLKDTWNSVTSGFSAILDGAKKWLKDKTGVDVDALMKKAGDTIAPVVDATKKAVAPVVQGVKDGAAVVADGAKKGATVVADYAKERVTKMAAPIAKVGGDLLDAGKSLFGGGSAGNKAAFMQTANTIADPKERAMFIATNSVESGGFRSMEESPKYHAKGFLANFGKRNGITTEAQAQAILNKGDSATFEAMYGGKWGAKNLGNTEAGDAEKFKGRGTGQLTGRANYAEVGKALGLDLVNHPELAADPINSANISKYFWDHKKGLSDAAKAGDVAGARKLYNGGNIGLAAVSEQYKAQLAANPGGPSPIVTASAAPPARAALPTVTVPAPAAAEPSAVANIPFKMNSPAPLDVRVSTDQLAGQDMSDRKLAHIATGGVSG